MKRELKCTERANCSILLIICIMICIAAFAHHDSIWNMILYILFQIFCVFLPGVVLQRKLKIPKLTELEQEVISYVCGYILTIIIYLLVMVGGLKDYVVLLFGIVGVSSLLILWTDKVVLIISKKDHLLFVVSIFTFFLLSLLASLQWTLPMANDNINCHGDLLYWVGDIVALKEDFLPINIRTLEPDYKYHYAGALQQAVISMTTGISAYKVGIYYSYIESAVLLCGSFYCLLKRTIKNKKVELLILGLLLLSTGIEEYCIVTYMWHLYILPMSFTVAMGFAVLIVWLILMQDKQACNGGLLIITILSLMVLTATKGPAGALALVAIGVICIYWFVIKYDFLKAILYGASSLIAFFSVYVLLLMEREQLYTTGESVEKAVWNYEQVWADLKGYLSYYVALNPWIFLPAIIYIFYCIFNKRKKIEDYMLIVVIICGTCLGYIIEYYGQSQMYFSLAVFPFAAILAGKLFLEIATHLLPIRSWYIYGVFLLCSVWTLHYNYTGELNKSIEKGLSSENICEEFGLTSSLSEEEYLAYDWIRSNTESSVLVLSDRWFEDSIQCRVQSVISERRFYNYDTGTINSEKGKNLYDGDANLLEEFNKIGITHIICHERVSPHFVLQKEVADLVYDEGGIAIYQCK